MPVSPEMGQDMLVEAALAKPEVKAAQAKLIEAIKTNHAFVSLATRFEPGAKMRFESQAFGVVEKESNNTRGGYQDVILFDGLGFTPKNKAEGMTGWTTMASNRNELKNQGVIKYDGELNAGTEGGSPMLITLITDKDRLQNMGVDKSMNGYCMLTAAIGVQTNEKMDRYNRSNIATTMKYIIPTAIAEEIAKVSAQEGPAAAWAILFKTAGYRLNPGLGVDYGKPTVDLEHKEKLGVARIEGSTKTVGPTTQKRSLFGR